MKGLYEVMDGPAIRLIDNLGLEKLKNKIPPDILPVVYQVVDELFEGLTNLSES